MNTLFEKKPALLGTWMHPATKRCHMIDYAVMCANQRMLGTDVQVMRGANCWNDHRLVRAKVYMKLFHTSYRKVQQAASFAVHSLLCCSQPRLLLTASFAAHSLLCCSQPPLLLTASFAAHSLLCCSQPRLLLTASFAAHSLLCCSQPPLLLTASFAAHSLVYCSQPPLLLTASFAAHSLVCCSQPPPTSAKGQLLQGFNAASRRKAIHAPMHCRTELRQREDMHTLYSREYNTTRQAKATRLFH